MGTKIPKSKEKKSKVAAIVTSISSPSITKHYSSKSMRLAVIGSLGSGKTTLLCSIYDEKTSYPTTSYSTTTRAQTVCTFLDYKIRGSSSSPHQSNNTFIHCVFTEIPVEDAAHQLSLLSSSYPSSSSEFDLVLFLFDSSNSYSLTCVLDLEKKYLNDDVPRVFIAVKNKKVCSIPSNKKTTSMSILESQGSSKSEDSPEEKQQQQQSCVNAAAIEHYTDLELERPYATTL